jgi:16S rRNA (guanine527-N7)-methyltransferase
MAICQPNLQVTTIDAVQKKTIFMRQVKGELGLANLQVVHARVEQYQAEPFEQIISRAFSELSLFVKITRHLLAKDGEWLAMKGLNPVHELDNLGMQAKTIIPLKVANLEAERHLLIFENK